MERAQDSAGEPLPRAACSRRLAAGLHAWAPSAWDPALLLPMHARAPTHTAAAGNTAQERDDIIALLEELRAAGKKQLTVLLLGKSSVGKSSLVNSFFNEVLARVQAFKLQADSEITTPFTKQVGVGRRGPGQCRQEVKEWVGAWAAALFFPMEARATLLLFESHTHSLLIHLGFFPCRWRPQTLRPRGSRSS
jgi:hypothetical protein